MSTWQRGFEAGRTAGMLALTLALEYKHWLTPQNAEVLRVALVERAAAEQRPCRRGGHSLQGRPEARQVEARVSAPVTAQSDDGAIFELLASVECAMPRRDSAEA